MRKKKNVALHNLASIETDIIKKLKTISRNTFYKIIRIAEVCVQNLLYKIRILECLTSNINCPREVLIFDFAEIKSHSRTTFYEIIFKYNIKFK